MCFSVYPIYGFPRAVLCSVAIIVCPLLQTAHKGPIPYIFQQQKKHIFCRYSFLCFFTPHKVIGMEAVTVLLVKSNKYIKDQESCHAMRDYPLTFPLPLLPQSPYTLLHRPPSLLMDWYHYLSNFTTIFLLYLTPLPTLIIILRILMLYHYIIYNMYHYQYCDLCFFSGNPWGPKSYPNQLTHTQGKNK